MQRNHIRPMLAMLTLILASLACGPQKEIVKGEVSCKLSYYSSTGFVYQCYCPKDASNSMKAEYTSKELQAADIAAVETAACANYQSTQTQNNSVPPTETPTAEPTSTPTKRPTATPAPYLSGEVTTCSLTDRYLNFSIDPNAADISGLDFEVTIGGVPSTCTIPPSNKGILSCTFPQGQTFPAQVIVNVDGSVTNNFSFDGSGCESKPAPAPDSGGDQPAPTEDPLTSG